ncbi:MAG TPA: neutral zinc metallopeptidase [Steroidobacteraceae bacterium]|nr:neutral zinc metallopeptidase [Steroidobacteraceae bacterium]
MRWRGEQESSNIEDRLVPDSFTHGTSAQRVRWFKRGIDRGDMEQCDTFKTEEL